MRVSSRSEESATPGDKESLEAFRPAAERPLRHPGRPILAIIVIVLLAVIVDLFVNANIEYSFVPKYLLSGVMIGAVGRTIGLAVVAQASGILIGAAIAGMRVSSNPVAKAFAAGYTWLFRGIPALVQLLLWYNLALVVPHLKLGIPFTSMTLFSVDTNHVITTFTAAWIGLALNESAYMSEIIRAGVLSVDPGQQEAALAVGMSPLQVTRRVTVPQAMRVIIPPTSNDFINMIKETSLASVISYMELTEAANSVSSANLQIMPALFAASIWYLVLVTAATLLQTAVERRLGTGDSGTRATGRTARRKRLAGLAGNLNPLDAMVR